MIICRLIMKVICHHQHYYFYYYYCYYYYCFKAWIHVNCTWIEQRANVASFYHNRRREKRDTMKVKIAIAIASRQNYKIIRRKERESEGACERGGEGEWEWDRERRNVSGKVKIIPTTAWGEKKEKILPIIIDDLELSPFFSIFWLVAR